MKKANIEKSINAKINKWLESIADEQLAKDLRQGVIVTGGCIVSMLLNEEVSDYDVYFKNKDLAMRVAEYYVSEFKSTHKGMDVSVNDEESRIKIYIKSQGIAEDVEAKDEALDESTESYVDAISKADEVPADAVEVPGAKYYPVFMSANAITLSNKIQLIIRFYGEPEEIHSNYDFLHCTCYWASWENKVHWTAEALDCIINKELFYRGSKYPICSIIRTRKFLKRGWSINAGQYLKMCFQVSELDLTNIATLEDQLTGVDSLYFMQAIESLKKVAEEKAANGERFTFDSTYLATIVDKIFK